ncbi:hypothetical protein C8A03DRAFT_31199 [Achaetomium macrosporum]|uniref:Uncharacterized protein n=1 Tax=Achaetomium macrosporum TaxID=79813 RepID=A0AAN7HHH7_9PEZI|nr:hypothetical protein C8A03DRAFT_31199 [Achaetomium macrosporum]
MSSYSDDSTEIGRDRIRIYERVHDRSPLGRAYPSHHGPPPYFIQTVRRDVRDPRPPTGYYPLHPQSGRSDSDDSDAYPKEPPVSQPRSKVWDQLEQLDSGVDQQHGKSLVSTRRSWDPNDGPPTLSDRKGFEPYVPGTAKPSGDLDHVDYEGFKRRRSFNKAPLAEHEEKRTKVQVDSGAYSEPSGTEVPVRRVDLVYDPSQAGKDMSIRLEFDVEEDWEEDLEDFCRLRRLGRFKEAKEYFRSKLEHVSSIPYIRVQYAEMLEACGDYKTLQNLVFRREFAPDPSEETPNDRNRGKLAANDALLELLSQRPNMTYVEAAWRVVHNTLQGLATETTMGSTEIQLLSLCLRVLHYIEMCTHENVVGPVKVYTKCLFDWRKLYHELAGESCVWDFRDLLVAAVSVFGWQEASALFFGTSYFPRALDIIVKDWDRPFYDEASTMGLLDLFTSLILQDSSDSMKAHSLLFLQHARVLAESVQSNDPELMRSRPFVQWLLVRSLVELEPPPEHPHAVHSSDPGGLKVDQGRGVNLPIYVPSRHGRKPDWNTISCRSTLMQRDVIEVANRVADEIGDYSSQATALKLLILHSQDPKTLMGALSRLQLETQRDRDGYLATCLSRYLIATGRDEGTQLLRELEKPGGPGNALYFEQCPNATLKWAWEVIRNLLSSAEGGTGSNNPGDRGPSPFINREIELDGSKLPPYIADFTRAELGVSVSPSMAPLYLEHSIPAGNNVQHAENGAQQGPLRDRVVRRAIKPEVNPGQANPWNPNAFDTGMYSSPAAGYPPGPPPPAFYPAGTVQMPPQDPWPFYSREQPDPLLHGISPSLEVSGWPPTWFEDAKRYAGAQAISQHPHNSEEGRPKKQGQESKSNERHGHQGGRDDRAGQKGGYEKEEKEASQDQKKANDNQNRPDQGQGKPGTGQKAPSDDQQRNKASDIQGKRAKILEQLKSLDDLYDNPDTEQAQAGSADEKPHISLEDGVTKLNFPSNILDGHGMTVLLTDRENPHKLKAYLVEKGGIFETIASARMHRRGDGPASNDTKSEYNIRTNSVSFDAASSSNESAVRRRASKGKGKMKGKGQAPSIPRGGGGENKTEGNAGAQKPARDKSEEPATNDPEGPSVSFSIETGKTEQPEPMMSGAADSGEQANRRSSGYSTKTDGPDSGGKTLGEETKGKENGADAGIETNDDIPPLPPTPPPTGQVEPPGLRDGRTISYGDNAIVIEALRRRHRGRRGIRVPSGRYYVIRTDTREVRDSRLSTNIDAQPEQPDQIITANRSQPAHPPPTTERGEPEEIETWSVTE